MLKGAILGLALEETAIARGVKIAERFEFDNAEGTAGGARLRS
jgi:hypothetical protein